MTITLTQRPHIFCFSKNPVQYKFTVPDYTAAGALIHVELYMKNIGVVGAGTLIYAEPIKPSSAETAINLQDIIDAALDYQLPDFSGGVIQSGFNHIKIFYIKYYHTTDADPDVVYSTDVTKLRYALKGGIANPEWDWNNYFVYLRGSLMFLTWQPNNCFVGLDDNFFISYLNTVAAVPLTLKVFVEYSDGTTANADHAFGDSGENLLYHIGAGVSQLGIDVTKQVYRYSISVVETATPATIFAGSFTYYIDYRQFYYTKFLHFYNSLGGLQYTRVRGDIEYEVPRKFSESERYHGITVIGAPAGEEYTQSGITKIDTFKGETGFIHAIAEYDTLQELLLTGFAWERRFFTPVPGGAGANLRIYITQSSAKMGSTADKKQSMSLEWRYTFSNQVYTPFIDLGTGVDEEDYTPAAPECVPVAYATSPVFPSGVTDVPYDYTINLNGNVPFTLSAIVKPDWMTITVTDSHITFTGTPTDEGTDIDVGFLITNPCGTLELATTIDVLSSVNFIETTFLTGGELEDNEIANIVGPPGSSVTVTYDSGVNSNGGNVRVNTGLAYIGNTWTFVIDGTGHYGLTVSIEGTAGPGIILAHFTITSVSPGGIGPNNVFQISKVF